MCYKVTGEICFVINVKTASLYTLKKNFKQNCLGIVIEKLLIKVHYYFNWRKSLCEHIVQMFLTRLATDIVK